MSAEDFARFSYFSDLAENNLTVCIIIWSRVDRTATRLFLICVTVEEISELGHNQGKKAS